MSIALGAAIPLALGHDAAIATVTEALKDEGFGVLTRVDLHDAFREKLGVTYKHHTILGACNPVLAHRALGREPLVGLVLPCNVTVEDDGAGGSLVRLVDPEAMLDMGDLDAGGTLAEVARDARARLGRVEAALRRG